jgi:hypothetical protein
MLTASILLADSAEELGWRLAFNCLLFVLFIATLVVGGVRNKKKKREEKTRAAWVEHKYAGDGAEIVERITRRMFWTGQTEEQLVDSIGRPRQVETIRAEPKQEVWKYREVNGIPCDLSITLEEGIVLGWDQKPPK